MSNVGELMADLVANPKALLRRVFSARKRRKPLGRNGTFTGLSLPEIRENSVENIISVGRSGVRATRSGSTATHPLASHSAVVSCCWREGDRGGGGGGWRRGERAGDEEAKDRERERGGEGGMPCCTLCIDSLKWTAISGRMLQVQ